MLSHRCKYLDDIGVSHSPMPCRDRKKQKIREARFKEQEKIYGFNDSETWDLDYTLIEFLYTRLKMFLEVNNVELDGIRFKIENDGKFEKIVGTFENNDVETITLQQLIEDAIEGFKDFLQSDSTRDDYETAHKHLSRIIEVLPHLWW